MEFVQKSYEPFVCAAQARASKVLPVPGGPYIRQPFGAWIPKLINLSLCVLKYEPCATNPMQRVLTIGRTIASTSSWICLSKKCFWIYRDFLANQITHLIHQYLNTVLLVFHQLQILSLDCHIQLAIFREPNMNPKLAMTLLSQGPIRCWGNLASKWFRTLLTPTKSPGVSSFCGTKPITGKKNVWRVDVFTTAHFPVS